MRGVKEGASESHALDSQGFIFLILTFTRGNPGNLVFISKDSYGQQL